MNRCIECGFCESNCPSRDVTITPRQRITVWREISRLRALPSRSPAEEASLATFTASFNHLGMSTCAADGMCQTKCPVGINTGELVKSLRADEVAATMPNSSRAAMALARNFSATVTAGRGVLAVLDTLHGVVGPRPLEYVSGALNRLSGRAVPVWNPHMPTAAPPLAQPVPPAARPAGEAARKVVYVPSCVTRMMGPERGNTADGAATDRVLSLLHKAGYEVVYPAGVGSLCCGMMFGSRGFKDAAGAKATELAAAVSAASDGGRLPVLLDTSPCLATLKESLSGGNAGLKLSLYEPVEFIHAFLMDKLRFDPLPTAVAVHVPCSSKKMGLEPAFAAVAGACASGGVTPSGVPCCGMAGDRGMRYPELTAGALQHVTTAGCSAGYSTSRTCEMSLTNHSGVPFKNIVYLVDQVTSPLGEASAAAGR